MEVESNSECQSEDTRDTFNYFADIWSQQPGTMVDASYIDHQDKDWNEILDRNGTYSQFIFAYTVSSNKKTKHQSIMKIWFFVIILFLLVALVISTCAAIIIIAKKPSLNTEDVATIITAISGVVASFLVIPKVIANNLFPKTEDDKTAQIFGDMIKSDLELRKYYFSPRDKSNK